MAATANIEYLSGEQAAPSAPTVTGNTGTGSGFTSGQQVQVAITWVTASGETTASTAATATIGATGDNVVVTVPSLPSGVIGANVYCSATNNGATLYKVASDQAAGSVTITAFASNTNPQPPSTNTAALATDDIENGGTKIRFNKSDDIVTTSTPVSVPQSAGTNYSYVKWIGMMVSVAAATSFTNLSIVLIAALTTGFGLFAVGVADTGYVQAGTGSAAMTDNATTDVTASGTTPTITGVSSQRLSTTPYTYDSTGASANVSPVDQIVGKLVALALGVGNSYTGGGGAVYISSSSGQSGVTISYDEA